MAIGDLHIPAYDRKAVVVSLFVEAPILNDIAMPAYDRECKLVALRLETAPNGALVVRLYDRKAVVVVAATVLVPTVWYVTPEGGAPMTGKSWATAFDNIQDGLDAADESETVKEIWVKEGTYTPPSTLTCEAGVELYGGFAGDESSRDERDWAANATIIDGQSARRCIEIDDGIVDGFTIQNGSSTNGAGGTINGANAILRHCIVQNNAASLVGGGFISTSPEGEAVLIENCAFIGNTAHNAGAFACNYQNGIFIYCSFTDNDAVNRGGAIYTQSGALAQIISCIIWDNTGPGGGASIYGPAWTYHSDVQWAQGTEQDGGNIAIDPIWVAPPANIHLQTTSPCKNTGLLSGDANDDLDGNDRPYPTTAVDMGCYEFQGA